VFHRLSDKSVPGSVALFYVAPYDFAPAEQGEREKAK
jgi:hypothetical protein